MQQPQPDHRGKIYRRTEDGMEALITVREALAEVNDAMMGRVSRERSVRTMSSSKGQHHIVYADGRTVTLLEIDPPATDSKGRRIVTAKGKRYVVGSVVRALEERKQINENSYFLPYPAYVHYWSVRDGEAWGPTRECSGRNKPGTVGHAIWSQVKP